MVLTFQKLFRKSGSGTLGSGTPVWTCSWNAGPTSFGCRYSTNAGKSRSSPPDQISDLVSRSSALEVRCSLMFEIAERAMLDQEFARSITGSIQVLAGNSSPHRLEAAPCANLPA